MNARAGKAGAKSLRSTSGRSTSGRSTSGLRAATRPINGLVVEIPTPGVALALVQDEGLAADVLDAIGETIRGCDLRVWAGYVVALLGGSGRAAVRALQAELGEAA